MYFVKYLFTFLCTLWWFYHISCDIFVPKQSRHKTDTYAHKMPQVCRIWSLHSHRGLSPLTVRPGTTCHYPTGYTKTTCVAPFVTRNRHILSEWSFAHSCGEDTWTELRLGRSKGWPEPIGVPYCHLTLCSCRKRCNICVRWTHQSRGPLELGHSFILIPIHPSFGWVKTNMDG